MDLIYGVPNKANYATHIKLGYKPCEYISWTFLTKSLNPLWLTSKLIAKIMLGKQVQEECSTFKPPAQKVYDREKIAAVLEKFQKT